MAQAIGRSRGERTTKIHALTDALCRPLAFRLTWTIRRLHRCRHVARRHGNKGYDSNAVRAKIVSAPPFRRVALYAEIYVRKFFDAD
jgi:hypothetical protein